MSVGWKPRRNAQGYHEVESRCLAATEPSDRGRPSDCWAFLRERPGFDRDGVAGRPSRGRAWDGGSVRTGPITSRVARASGPLIPGTALLRDETRGQGVVPLLRTTPRYFAAFTSTGLLVLQTEIRSVSSMLSDSAFAPLGRANPPCPGRPSPSDLPQRAPRRLSEDGPYAGASCRRAPRNPISRFSLSGASHVLLRRCGDERSRR
jgi:hypothetical protein